MAVLLSTYLIETPMISLKVALVSVTFVILEYSNASFLRDSLPNVRIVLAAKLLVFMELLDFIETLIEAMSI